MKNYKLVIKVCEYSNSISHIIRWVACNKKLLLFYILIQVFHNTFLFVNFKYAEIILNIGIHNSISPTLKIVQFYTLLINPLSIQKQI